ncbi:MAG: hypothetical protein JST26_03490 [Bacteroidetes bacterium]|nr:hypothetical protein [Bacteroidota bacterium]
MKTLSILTAAICLITASIHAQTVVYGGNPNHHPKDNGYNQPNTQNNDHPSKKMGYGNNGWYNNGPGWGGNVNISFGNNPSYGYPQYGYNNYYGNGYYSMRKAARYAINKSGAMLNNATWYESWDNMYSPMLAKAIRHQQYARQLYYWGDYAGAYNHAERAAYLAGYVISFYNNPGAYNNGPYNGGPVNNYPNPYSDPYNPYYKQSNPDATNDPAYQPGDDAGFKKQKETTEPSGQDTNKPAELSIKRTGNSELDSRLPASTQDDKTLLKSIKTNELLVE